jgi:predicted DsbA family dithiol-disulfide isomerase
MDEVMRAPMNPANPLRFSVLRVPFFLEPDYERDESWSETNRTRLERKWGGKAAFAAQKHRHRLKERGREVGIEHFNLDRLASNTLNSHRLVQWVTKREGCAVAEALYNDLNQRHFVDGQKLNDSEMLADAAASAGVDRAEALAFLASDEGYAEIVAARKTLEKMGIHSIPNFVIGGQYVVSGAVHSDELVQIFRTVEKNGRGAPDGAFAETLGIPIEMRETTMPAPDDAPRGA